MIFQYGKTIKDKIAMEKNGEITGVPCNVFDLASGKDFVLSVREISTGDETYPDYKNSMFKPEITSLPVYFEAKNEFKNVPVVDGRVAAQHQNMVIEFLLKRDHELEDFAPKRLTEEQQAKINEISAYLTGKASSSYQVASKPTSDDFDIDGIVTSGSKETPTSNLDDDDFFSDFG